MTYNQQDSISDLEKDRLTGVGAANATAARVTTEPDAPLDVDGSPGQARTPTISNVTTVVAGTEYSHTFQNDTKRFILKARGQNSILQIAFISGQTGTTFITLYQGVVYSEEDLDLQGLTIYFQSNKAGEIVEILEWAK